MPPAGARTIALALKPSVKLIDVRLNGRPVEALSPPGAKTRIYWAAAADGVTMTFKAAGPGALEVGYVSVAETWPADARPLPARAADVMAFDASDATLVGGTQRFTW